MDMKAFFSWSPSSNVGPGMLSTIDASNDSVYKNMEIHVLAIWLQAHLGQLACYLVRFQGNLDL